MELSTGNLLFPTTPLTLGKGHLPCFVGIGKRSVFTRGLNGLFRPSSSSSPRVDRVARFSQCARQKCHLSKITPVRLKTFAA